MTPVPIGTPLNRTGLVKTLDADFDTTPLSRYYDRSPQTSPATPPAPGTTGQCKTTWEYANPYGISSRIVPPMVPPAVVPDLSVLVDPNWCGQDMAPQYGGTQYLLVKPIPAGNLTNPKYGYGADTTGTRPYMAAVLSWERTFSQLYGVFEIEALMPSDPGFHPCFWLRETPVNDTTGTQWDNGAGYGPQWTGGLNGEIDICEFQTSRQTTVFQFATSGGQVWPGVPGAAAPVPQVPAPVNGENIYAPTCGFNIHQLHRYAVDWQADVISFYVDDACSYSLLNPGLHQPMYPIWSMGTGGWLSDNVVPAIITDSAAVAHHIRAWHR